MRLGTSVIQMSARTPTACAMAALTLDHLSGGRHILGLGVSGPQVVEGWYGQKFPKPLARTREYIDILRKVWAREAPVTSDGPHYPLPLSGEGTGALTRERQSSAGHRVLRGPNRDVDVLRGCLASRASRTSARTSLDGKDIADPPERWRQHCHGTRRTEPVYCRRYPDSAYLHQREFNKVSEPQTR